MDSDTPSAVPADYAGLKEELQKIAAIIEQYPDQLKQRTFELLINAYLARATAQKISTAGEAQSAGNSTAEKQAGAALVDAAASEEQAGESALAEAPPLDAGENSTPGVYAVRSEEPADSELEPDSRINANIENTTNMLRRRLRLRTMSQMPWHQSS